MNRKHVILLGGPTGSGKSAVALALARLMRESGGAVIINSDSMQIYRDLRILTARPTPQDEALVQHKLYGFISAKEVSSVGIWRKQAELEIKYAWDNGALPIVVGGTGLYFHALVNGLAPIPDISTEIKLSAAKIVQQGGIQALYNDLLKHDPAIAGRIVSKDRQRIIRAWEVRAGTGRSITEWQKQVSSTPLSAEWHGYKILPERRALYRRIDNRFSSMIRAGVIEEVKHFMDKGIAVSMPCARAVGLRELSAHIAGELALDEAIAAGQQASRRLAKRQYTWFRNQMTSWAIFEQDIERIINQIFTNICSFRLTGSS